MSILKKITTILFILCITGVSNAYPEAWEIGRASCRERVSSPV